MEVAAEVVAEGLRAEVTCLVVGLSVSRFHGCASAFRRSVRQAPIADVRRVVDAESRLTYGARRVHAESFSDGG